MSRKREAEWHAYAKIDSSEELIDKSAPEYSSSEEEATASELDCQQGAILQSYRRRIAILTGAVLCLFLSTVGLLVALLLKKSTDHECGVQTSIWSPANEAIEFVETDFENTFAHETIYRGVPSKELELAWQDLWYHGALRVPEDKLPLLNRTYDLGDGRTLRPWDDGKGGYHAMLEVSHQIHCLNLVRQYTWRDWYKRHQDIVRPPPDMMNSDVAARMHADHCIETLRLALMCHADTTPSLSQLDPTAPHGSRADFGPHHKCRKFDKIQDWLKENQVDEPPPVEWEPFDTPVIYELPDKR